MAGHSIGRQEKVRGHIRSSESEEVKKVLLDRGFNCMGREK